MQPTPPSASDSPREVECVRAYPRHMTVTSTFSWRDGVLERAERAAGTAAAVVAAESWHVGDGMALALHLHRSRFVSTVGRSAERFWDASIRRIPGEGDWHPRVEADSHGALTFRLRPAPERSKSVVLATGRGGDEAVILSADGQVVEGTSGSLLWWRGDILCSPPGELQRTDSITARSVLTLAQALGFDTHEEAVTPAELEGTELWTADALHGVRIATRWIGGPDLAERPGRIGLWRDRLDALRRPIR